MRIAMAAGSYSPAVASRRAKYDGDFRVPALFTYHNFYMHIQLAREIKCPQLPNDLRSPDNIPSLIYTPHLQRK